MKYSFLRIETGSPKIEIPDGAIIVACQPAPGQGIAGDDPNFGQVPYDGDFMFAQFWQFLILVPEKEESKEK